MKMTEEELMGKIGTVMDEKLKPLLTIDTSARPKDEAEAKDEQQGFKSFGELLQAVAKSETEHKVDQRLIYTKQLGMNEGVGAEGGFLVAPEFSKKLLMQTYETGILSKDCMKIPMKSNRLTMNAVDETSRVSGSRAGGLCTY